MYQGINVRNVIRLLIGFCLLVTASLVVSNGCGGGGGTTPTPQPPSITAFTAAPSDFSPGDTLTLSYTVTGADSVTFAPPLQKLAQSSAGSVKMVPRHATHYVLIAYNSEGQDTATVDVGISIAIPNGLYYRGFLDSSRVSPAMSFRVTDAASAVMTKPWVHFSRIDGDGLLSADSLRPNLSGIASPAYTFGDSIGHAIIRAIVPGFDTADVNIRAQVLNSGPHGQGQYISLDDTYGTVKLIDGVPASNDVDPSYWITYANYEAATGVVVEIDDPNHNSQADDGEGVLGVIVTTIYGGKTHMGIGIGSSYASVVAAYGPPDSLHYDPTPPAAYIIKYIHLGLVLIGVPADTSIEQIEVSEFVQGAPALKPSAERISVGDRSALRAPRFR
jgi:hypothetical protein